MRKMRRIGVIASVALASVFGAMASAPSASASVWVSSSTVNNCDSECLVLFYNSQYGGSRITLNTNGDEQGFYNLGPYTFQTTGAGQGQSVKNQAASAQARHWGAHWNATIYYNSGYAGPCDRLQAGADSTSEITYASKLVNTYNNDASVYWRSSVMAQGCTYWQ